MIFFVVKILLGRIGRFFLENSYNEIAEGIEILQRFGGVNEIIMAGAGGVGGGDSDFRST